MSMKAFRLPRWTPLAFDAEVDQPRLFESGDDLEVDIRFLPDAFDEDVAVFRVARGGRGDRVDFFRAGFRAMSAKRRRTRIVRSIASGAAAA